MSLQIKFTIEEAADALSFTFKDITGTYDVTTNPGGWGAPNITPAVIDEAALLVRYQDGSETEYPLDVVGGSIDNWINGIEIFSHDIVLPYPVIQEAYPDKFPDGIYDFRVWIKDTSDDEYLSDSLVMGFCAIITGEVMKSSLSYKVSAKRTYKEWVLERMRLLDNLRYSADTGNLQHFQDNLTTLQRLK